MDVGPKSQVDPETSGEYIWMEQNDAVLELLSPEIPIREELIEEVMQELYREITKTTSFNLEPPSAAAVAATTSLTTSFLLDNSGKSETCGASVSDSASTMMAGIEFVGPASAGNVGSNHIDHHKLEINGGCLTEKIMMISSAGKGISDGCDGEELDDEWLARVLSWGPLDFDP